LQMFDVRREPPALLCAGDRVRFRSITREEFDSLG
jgi:allophanate hydrolase subunit 1